jgi:hypothetical protein
MYPMASKKTWTEKMQSDKTPVVKRIDAAFADMPANSRMLIATPQIIDEYIRQIPKGTMVPLQTMRKDLALEYHADFTCPLTTGIFLRIVAEAGFEKYQQTNSIKGMTPFWRVIDAHSPLSKKLQCGPDFILARQKAEKIMA